MVDHILRHIHRREKKIGRGLTLSCPPLAQVFYIRLCLSHTWYPENAGSRHSCIYILQYRGSD